MDTSGEGATASEAPASGTDIIPASGTQVVDSVRRRQPLQALPSQNWSHTQLAVLRLQTRNVSMSESQRLPTGASSGQV
jgi:hypothetical protein